MTFRAIFTKMSKKKEACQHSVKEQMNEYRNLLTPVLYFCLQCSSEAVERSSWPHTFLTLWDKNSGVFKKWACSGWTEEIYLNLGVIRAHEGTEVRGEKKHKSSAINSRRAWASAPASLCHPARRTRSSPTLQPEEKQVNYWKKGFKNSLK